MALRRMTFANLASRHKEARMTTVMRSIAAKPVTSGRQRHGGTKALDAWEPIFWRAKPDKT
jgi:hypothetical protein